MSDNFEPIVLVTRGDELPKKNYEKKVHPTYETSIRIRNLKTNTLTPVHVVVKFFDQYRSLEEQLAALDIGENKKIQIAAPFPRSYKRSMVGIGLSEDDLQQRCFQLNKWMQALFAVYSQFPLEAQKLVSEFLSLHDDNQQLEDNKELILSLLLNASSAKSPELTSTGTTTLTPSSSSQNLAALTTTIANNNNTATLGSDESPTKAANRAKSTRMSITADGPSLSSAELEEYSKEIIIGDCLAVSVLRGEMIPKRPNETRLHYSYEAIVRMLPPEDLPASYVHEIDLEEYAHDVEVFQTIQVMKVFDAYRSLKEKLETEFGIFSIDNTTKITEYNESDAHLLHPAIVVPAEFPKTYRRSALGIGLSEAQAQVRVVYLNHWLGELLKLFPKLPIKAQLAIHDFFGLNPLPPAGIVTAEGQQTELFLDILKGEYELPRVSLNTNNTTVKEKSKRKYLSSLFVGKKSEKDKEKGDTLPTPPAESSLKATPPPAPSNNQVDDMDSEESDPEELGKDVRTEITSASSVLPAQQILEYSKESRLHYFLGVLVKKGEALAKKQNDSKLHLGYQTTIRILFSTEVPASKLDPQQHDIEGYDGRYACLPMHSVTKVFDGYRTLSQTLEQYNVFALDRAHHSKSMNGCIVIEAKFPRTHKRSAFGIKLTEKEITQRTAELNHWMGALLGKFHQYSATVQDLIQEFLQLDMDNPAEPHSKFLIQMLKREFQPPALPPKPQGKQKTSGFGATAGKRKTLLGIIEERPKRQPGDLEEEFNRIGVTGEEGEEDLEHMPGNGVQCGCQCVVM